MSFEAMEALLHEHVDAVAKMESATLHKLETADEIVAFVFGRFAQMIGYHTKFILRLDRHPTEEEMIGVCMGIIRIGSDLEPIDPPRIHVIMKQILNMADLINLDFPARPNASAPAPAGRRASTKRRR